MNYVGCKVAYRIVAELAEESFIWTMWDVKKLNLGSTFFKIPSFIWTMWDVKGQL